jgi:predicted flap endonuclease-1-like 5' DNA nuclease
MTTKENTPQDYMSQLLDLQQQYLKNMEQAFKLSQPAAETPANPFEAWWQQFPKSGQNDFDSFFKNMSEVGMGFMQDPLGSMQEQAGKVQDMTNWLNTMNQQFSNWSNASSMVNPVFGQMNDQFKQQMLAPFGISMPWMQNQFKPEQLSDVMNSSVLNLMQNLFKGKEKEAGERLLKKLEEYQNGLMQYNQLMAKVGIDSLTQLQKKMTEMEGKSVEEVYKWWMKASQDVFNRENLSEPYKKLQTQLEAIQQALKTDYENYRLSLISNLGLVSRAEYDALKLQLDSLKAELEELKGQSAQPGSASQSGDQADDFTVISGVGKKFNDKLHEQGIKNLQQLASMSDQMLKNLDTDLQAKGRVLQDQWREQAEQFLKTMTGKK